MKVLVIDVGGTNIKFRLTGWEAKRKEPSGDRFGPEDFLRAAEPVVAEARPEAVTVGFPSVVRDHLVVEDPTNLGSGWIGFDFGRALGCPTKVINDAAMQALGAYGNSGRMLFLGLGTGLGSAIIDSGRIVPLELGRLRYSRNKTLEDAVSKKALKKEGRASWERCVWEVVGLLKDALLTESIAIGGGNAKHLEQVPDGVRIGDNQDAFTGGIRLWEDTSIELCGGSVA